MTTKQKRIIKKECVTVHLLWPFYSIDLQFLWINFIGHFSEKMQRNRRERQYWIILVHFSAGSLHLHHKWFFFKSRETEEKSNINWKQYWISLQFVCKYYSNQICREIAKKFLSLFFCNFCAKMVSIVELTEKSVDILQRNMQNNSWEVFPPEYLLLSTHLCSLFTFPHFWNLFRTLSQLLCNFSASFLYYFCTTSILLQHFVLHLCNFH